MNITDEMVKTVDAIGARYNCPPLAMRLALEAVAPMLMTEKSAIAFLETKGWVFTDTEHLLQ